MGSTGGRVVPVAVAQELGAVVEGVAKGLVLAVEHITARHEDLFVGRTRITCQLEIMLLARLPRDAGLHKAKGAKKGNGGRTRSKAVEQARGWVAAKTGLGPMMTGSKDFNDWLCMSGDGSSSRRRKNAPESILVGQGRRQWEEGGDGVTRKAWETASF